MHKISLEALSYVKNAIMYSVVIAVTAETKLYHSLAVTHQISPGMQFK